MFSKFSSLNTFFTFRFSIAILLVFNNLNIYSQNNELFVDSLDDSFFENNDYQNINGNTKNKEAIINVNDFENNNSRLDTNTVFRNREDLSIYSFAFKFNMSGNYTYINRNRSVINNPMGYDNAFGLAFYRCNFLIGWSGGTTKTHDETIINNLLLNSNRSINYTRNYLNFGYSLDVFKKVSIEPFIGLTRVKISVNNEFEYGVKYDELRLGGIDLGLTIHYYFFTTFLAYPNNITTSSLFFTLGYANINYNNNLNYKLKNHHYTFNVGLSLKLFTKQKKMNGYEK
jgi:hypothetical protein